MVAKGRFMLKRDLSLMRLMFILHVQLLMDAGFIEATEIKSAHS